MKFAFTPFDKAIVAAVLGPLIVLATDFVNNVALSWPGSVEQAGLAAIVAGLLVYLKGNAPGKV
jgi:hypothetical protein